MLQRWPLYSLILGVGLFCVLSLSGCDTVDSIGKLFQTDKDANAQSTQLFDRPIQTISIVIGTFSIDADNTIALTTNVDVKDNGTIVYQQITGRAFFTLANTNNVSTVTLTSDSVIIERPEANLLTLINISLR